MFTLNRPYCVGRSHKRIKAILPDDAFEKWRLVIDTPWRLKRHEDSNAFAFESVDPRQSRRISYKAPSQLPEGTKDKGRMKKVCGSWPENSVFVATWTRTRAVEKTNVWHLTDCHYHKRMPLFFHATFSTFGRLDLCLSIPLHHNLSLRTKISKTLDWWYWTISDFYLLNKL